MENRRPEITISDVQRIVTETCHWNVQKIDLLDSFEDRNFVVKYESAAGSQSKEDLQAVVKLVHTKKFCQQKVEVERRVMEHLINEGFTCTSCLSFPDGKWHHYTDDGKYVFRLFSFIPGVTLKSCLHQIDSKSMLMDLGSFVGKLHKSLQKVRKTLVVEDRPTDPWILQNSSILRDLLKEIQDTSEEKEHLILNTLESFEHHVMTSFNDLPKGVVHNDIHDLNIIVNYRDGKLQPLGSSMEENCVKAKFGLIDFNDVAVSPYLFEVAMVIRDLMVDIKDVPHLEIGAYFLSGYTEVSKISGKELQLLPYCIQAGLCQYIVVGENEFQKQPDNEYTRLGADNAWTVLQKLQHISNSDILNVWERIVDI